MYIFISIIYFFVLSLDKGKNLFSEINLNDATYSIDAGQEEDIVFSSLDSLKQKVDSVGVENLAKEFGVDEPIANFVITQFGKVVEKRGEGFTELIFKNVSILMFVMLPIFAFLLFLLFRKNKHYYLEHLIHSFHIHTFIFLFLSIYILFSTYIYDIFSWGIAMLVPFIYTLFSISRVYGYKKTGTFFRTSTLIFTYSIILFFGIIASIGLSVLVY